MNTRFVRRQAADKGRSFALLLLLAVCGSVHAEGQPPPNPYLSAPVYGITHFNSAQTDTIPYPVQRGVFRVDLSKQPRAPGGPINIQCIAAASPGFMWAASTERVAYIDARNGGWKVLAETGLPGARRIPRAELDRLLKPRFRSEAQVEALAKSVLGPVPQRITDSGLYVAADRDNVLYVNGGTFVHAFGLKNARNPKAGIEVKRSFDSAKVLPPMSLFGGPPTVRLIGMAMTYDGHLIVGAQNALLAIDREFRKTPVVHLLEDGHLLKDSISVDEHNGLYVATSNLQPRGDGLMRRLVWTGSAISNREADGAWSSPYDGGDWPPAVKAGTGTGSTPTLMGFEKDRDQLVVITDGVNRYKLVAFWRGAIPADWQQIPGTKSRRIAGQIQLTAGLPADTPWVQSEQSVVVNGWGAFVVNNMVPKGHPDKLVDVLVNGPVTAPPVGMERVEWDPVRHAWRTVWARGDVASTSMVPIASTPSRLVFVNGYSQAEGWEVTGLDWDTGKVEFRSVFGHDNLGNGAYAILQFLENGDLLFNSVGGPIRVRLQPR